MELRGKTWPTSKPELRNAPADEIISRIRNNPGKRAKQDWALVWVALISFVNGLEKVSPTARAFRRNPNDFAVRDLAFGDIQGDPPPWILESDLGRALRDYRA